MTPVVQAATIEAPAASAGVNPIQITPVMAEQLAGQFQKFFTSDASASDMLSFGPALSSLGRADLADPATRAALQAVGGVVLAEARSLLSAASQQSDAGSETARMARARKLEVLNIPFLLEIIPNEERPHFAQEVQKAREQLPDSQRAQIAQEIRAIAASSDFKLALDASETSFEGRENIPPGWEMRRPLSADGKAALAALPEETKKTLKRNPAADYEDYLVTPDDVTRWAKRYQEITGTRPAFAEDLVQFMRDQGDALMSLFERPARIGIVSFSGKKSDELAMKTMLTAMLWQLHKEGIPLSDIAIVGGLTDLGGIKAAYEAAGLFNPVESQGISGGKAIVYPVAPVDKAAVVGTEFGAESRLFLETANFIIGMGGGAQGERELRWFIQRRSDRAFLAEGFLEIKKDGAKAPGAVEKIEPSLGGHRVARAADNPLQAGADIGRAIARIIKAERDERSDSPLLQLAMSQPGGKSVLEVERAAEAQAGRYRLLRILNAVKKKLVAAGVALALTSDPLAETATRLLDAVRGVDNFSENAVWQQKAVQALEMGPQVVASVAKELSMDVMFASWFGLRDYSTSSSYFDKHASAIPERNLIALPARDSHTFDVKDYAEVRLDMATSAILRAMGSATEIFLGSDEEMRLYYQSKGYGTARKLADSNGTNYYLFSKGDERLAVIHGVDSESRLTHVTSLLRLNGVDASQIKVRGELQRVRALNRTQLEMHLAQLDHPIGAVIVGDKSNSIAELARRAGVAPNRIQHEYANVGPFRFERMLVKAVGSEQPYYILSFSPAYGELTYDLVSAAYAVGARNFMLAGAGGTFLAGDKVGAVHTVVSSEYQGQSLDLREIAGVEILPIPGAPEVHNITSPTPLEQDQNYVKTVMARGVGDVDQETFHALAAVRDALAADRAKGEHASKVLIQPGLYQSDVVGSGGLAASTVDIQYGPKVMAMAGGFFESLGLAAVSGQEEFLPLANAQTGALSQANTHSMADLAGVKIEAQDLSTVWSTQGWGHFIKQFKGQKRVLEIATEPFVSTEKAYLRQLFSRLKAKQFWITVRQSDPNAVDVLNMAREKGFETLLIRDMPTEAVHGSPTFVLNAKDAAEADSWFDDLVKPADNDAYEPNRGKHRRLTLGAGHEAVADRPDFISRAEFDLAEASKLALEMNREASASNEKVKAAVLERFADAGKAEPAFLEPGEVEQFLDGRAPVLISGASKKAWPNISADNQALVRDTLEKFFDRLDPRRHVVVTGGTEFGVEQIAHEIAARKGFDILSTITENTNAPDVTLHATALVPTSINWYGKSRFVLDMIRSHNGIVLFQGGGAILKDEIELAGRMGVRRFLQRAPEGAAADAAAGNPNEAFSTFDDMRPRLDQLLGPPQAAGIAKSNP